MLQRGDSPGKVTRMKTHFVPKRLTLASLAGLLLLLVSSPLVNAQGEAKHGGTLIYALGADVHTLNPAITTDVEALAVSCKMFNGLVWIDRNLEVQPELAESWDISEDGLTFTFHLRNDVRWHDGTPFSSADVKFSFEEVLGKYHPRTRGAFERVSSVEAPDDYTVIVRFDEPYAPFLNHMTCQDGGIVPKHIYEGTDILSNPANQADPVGTGPFVFEEWVRGSRIVMTRNDDYFREGLPYLDRLVARVMPDPTSRVVGLLSGEVDYSQSYFLPNADIARLEASPNVQTQRDTDLPGNYVMFLNVNNPPLDDPAVRQALLVGLNREQIVDQAFFSLGSPGESAIHRALGWASNPDVSYSDRYAYDPERANELLDELGLERGANNMRFSVRVLYDPGQAGFNAMSQIIRDNWAEIGVDAKLEPFENQVVADLGYNKRDFDTLLMGYTTGGDVAVGVSRQYVSIEPGAAFTNPTNYSNARVDELFEIGASTPFVEERQAAYFELQEILAEDLPVFNLVDRTEIDAAAVGLVGLWESIQPYDRWDQVGWAE